MSVTIISQALLLRVLPFFQFLVGQKITHRLLYTLSIGLQNPPQYNRQTQINNKLSCKILLINKQISSEMNINGSNTKVSYRQVSSQYVPQPLHPHQIKHNFVHESITVKNTNNQLVQYAPKLIKTGYILGDPVAFIQQNKLPQNYLSFSPNRSHVINDPIIVNNSTGQKWFMKPQGFMEINHQQQDYRHRSFSANESNNQTLHGSNGKQSIQTVSRAEFDKLSMQYKNLSNSYTQLLLSHTQTKQTSSYESVLVQQNLQLKQRISNLQYSLKQKQARERQTSSSFSKISLRSQITPYMQNILSNLMQKYRESILQQQGLLIDRFRLECKQDQLKQRQRKMHENFQKQPTRNSSMKNSRNNSTHYRKNNN